MRRTLSLGIAILVALAASAAAAAAPPEIGGPPTNDDGRCDRSLRPCGDAIVIGIGHHPDGRSEIVAHSSKDGLCIWVDAPDDLGRSSTGACGVAPLPPGGDAIAMSTWGYSRPLSATTSAISGPLRPDVAKVRVSYRRHGERREKSAAVAQVAEPLLAVLDQTVPFGYFEIAVRGCISPKTFRVVAFDTGGNIVGSDGPPATRFSGCERGISEGVTEIYERARAAGG